MNGEWVPDVCDDTFKTDKTDKTKETKETSETKGKEKCHQGKEKITKGCRS